MPFCTDCSIRIEKKRWVGHLKTNKHKINSAKEIKNGVFEISSAFKGRISSYRIMATDLFKFCLPESFLNSLKCKLKSLILNSLQRHVCLKVNFEYFSNFILFKDNKQEIKSFATKNFSVHQNWQFEELFQKLVISIKKKIEEFQDRDSGWTFLSNLFLEVNVNKYKPLKASSFIDLPKFLKNKKACINIRNNDNFCFLWCIIAALYPSKCHSDRVSSYPHFKNILKTDDMKFPVTLADISTFERNNIDICINVYALKDNRTIVGPLYRSNYKRKYRINLLLIEHGNKSHYVLINNLSRLVRSQITNHHSKLYFCEDCLLFFSTEDGISSHICSGVATILPQKGTYLEFKHFDRKQDVPFVVYADFETILQPYQNCDPDPGSSFTLNKQIHIPAAFAYHIICSYDNRLNRFVQYRGPDCAQKFVEYLYRHVKEIHDILKKEVPMIFTEEDCIAYKSAKNCHICKGVLFIDKVRDHCHLTGSYRGAAHQYCNLRFRVPKLIPIFFHNLAGYDCHLFIKELGKCSGPVKIIPKNKENYISFTKFLMISNEEYAQIRFVDSYKFLGTSLEKLANGLHKSDFIHLKKFYPDTKKFNLLTRKGVYPYDYMSDWDKFGDTELPGKNSFFNSLTGEQINDSDYAHAQSIWSIFKIKNMGEYTDLYLKTDVLLLSDIFENFRLICKLNYQLDPAFYLTAPSLSFDAMLLKTRVRLELISELEIIRLIQKGIRGGICMCATRYAHANNKYMENYDNGMPDSFLVYVDCNNLYGYSMCQSLPMADFHFLDHLEIAKLDILSVDDDAEFGFILEVDMLYPEHLHQSHNDYPFCAQKCIPPGGKTSKLIPNLYDKYEYVIHYVHLKTCLRNGLTLSKIHRILRFRQSPFLKQYIDLNTELRKKADTPFQQDLFKLMNNSVFGKTLEDGERRVDVKLVNQWCDSRNKTKKFTCADKLIARPNFHSATVLSENLVAVQMKPERVILDKPIYVGFAVLELSKNHMYQFHYSVMKPHYQEKICLCYTDTDSFIYSIQTEDFYHDLKKHFLHFFDTSNFNSENVQKIPLKNKKIPGLFKDELGGELITEFIGLRSKLYCIKSEKSLIKKAKGIKRPAVQELTLNDYRDVLINDKIIRKRNILFKSIRHEIFTQSVNKIALCNKDDKRYILSDKISTKAWGHMSIF